MLKLTCEIQNAVDTGRNSRRDYILTSDWFMFTGPKIILVEIDFLIFKGHTDGVLYRNCRWED